MTVGSYYAMGRVKKVKGGYQCINQNQFIFWSRYVVLTYLS